MKRTQLIVAMALSFCVGAIAEKPKKHKPRAITGVIKPAPGSGFATRTKTVAVTEAPPKFQEIIELLGAEKDGKPLAIWCGTGYLNEKNHAKKLKGQFETVLKYRQSLNTCTDELSNQVKTFLDEYIETLSTENEGDKYGNALEGIENPRKNIRGMESVLRFHEPLKKFLEEKAKKLGAKKEAFEAADAALAAALDSIFEVCVAKTFKPSTDARTTQKIDEFNAQVASQTRDGFKDEHACALEVEDPAAPVIDDQNSSTTEEGGSEGGEGGETPPHTDAPPQDPSDGTGAIGGSGPQGAVQPTPPPLAQPFNNQALFDPNAAQLQDLSDREADALRGQAELLQQALAQANRPNRVGGSPDNSRAFSAPPVSVAPQPGNQNQQQPQQQPYPPMQIPPFQPVPIPAAAPIPPELLSALARSNSTPRVDPNAAAASQAMMEMARLQQQMMQAQMANQMNMNNQGANRNANRIRGSAAFRGNRGRAGTRFMNQGRRLMSRNASRDVSGARGASRLAR